MSGIKIYSVSDKYISYLRSDKRLHNVFDNKEDTRMHTRKYLGVALTKGEFNYFIPFSSPKRTDYIVLPDGSTAIRKSIIPIIRMITNDTVSGDAELKGTLKLSNMIPVPSGELSPYDISQETDANYRQIVQKEWDFIKSNLSMIRKNATIIYNQKTKCDTLYAGKKQPGYLADTVDFQYAEEKCKEFQSKQEQQDKGDLV